MSTVSHPINNLVEAMKGFFMLLVSVAFLFCPTKGQNGTIRCSQIFRRAQRHGVNLSGTLEIPVDEQFPRFHVRMKFSRAVHHVLVRQILARDTGSHKEFVVDPTDMQKNGILRLQTFVRLTSLFAPTPKLLGVVYNGKLVCGDNVFDDAVLIDLKTSTRRSLPIIEVTSKRSSPPEEEEEIFN